MLKTYNTVGVIGTGRIGLPVAYLCAMRGYKVVGIEKNEYILEKIGRGISPFHEQGLEDAIKKYPVDFTSDIGMISSCDVILVTVGTPLGENMVPVMDAVFGVADDIATYAKKGALVLLKSTVAPGTTQKIYLELVNKGRDDILLAFVPERIVEGKAFSEFPHIPKIVGGVHADATDAAVAFMKSISDSIVLPTSLANAEIIKIFDNTYRSMKIGIANEFAEICEKLGVDYEQIRTIGNKDYGRNDHWSSGIWGGPCLSKDPYLLSTIDFKPSILLGMLSFFERHIDIIADKIEHILVTVNGKKIGLLGLAFKKDVDDTRESPAMYLRRKLEQRGALISAYDPFVGGSLNEVLECEMIIIATNHDAFRDIHFPKHARVFDAVSLFKDLDVKEYYRWGKSSQIDTHTS